MRLLTNYLWAFVLVLCTSLAALSSYAQREVIDDDPYQTRIILQLKLADFECGMSDILRYGVGFRADYFFPKFASINAVWHQAVYSTMLSIDAEISENKNPNLSQFRLLEAGGRLHLRERESSVNMSVSLGSKGAFTYWGNVEFPALKIFGLRGGVFSTSVPVTSEWSTYDGGLFGGIVTKDGTVIGRPFEVFTNMTTSGVYGGLTWSQFANAKYQAYGRTWTSRFFKEVYFDVFYAPKVQFEPFVVEESGSGNLVEYEIEPNMEGSLDTNSIGWRVGVYRVRAKRKLNVMFGLEAGARPGVLFRGGYFTSSVALSFSS